MSAAPARVPLGTVPLHLAITWVAIPLSFGVAILAILVGGAGIYATLGDEDRGQMRTVMRHPLRTVFGADEPDAEDEE